MFLLYDDENDYYQLENLAEKRPEVVRELKERLEKKLRETNDNWRD